MPRGIRQVLVGMSGGMLNVQALINGNSRAPSLSIYEEGSSTSPTTIVFLVHIEYNENYWIHVILTLNIYLLIHIGFKLYDLLLVGGVVTGFNYT